MSGVVDFGRSGVLGVTQKPKRYDMDLYQGDTFAFYLTFSGTDLNVAGWTAASTVHTVDNAGTPVVTTGIITIDPIDIVNKRFLVKVNSETLTPAPAREFRYDIQVTDSSGNKRTYIGGKITVTEDITES